MEGSHLHDHNSRLSVMGVGATEATTDTKNSPSCCNVAICWQILISA